PIIDASGLLSKEEIAAEDAFSVLLLRERNHVMVDRAKPLIEAGGAFIAVGAFHLSGKDGLVALLRGDGFTLTPLW
ncbi:MAG TPA: TraB/GumN family protein, partial [Roseiarcus sp.]|nr:TraB/GumN family protein [Roseiarcus sp.]